MYVHPLPSVSWELTMLPERCKHKSYLFMKENSEKKTLYFATTGKRFLKKKTPSAGHNNEYSDVTCK